MKKRNAVEELELVKWISLVVLFIAVAFIAGGAFIVGVIIVGIGGYIDWKFYRCPHCHKNLDTRMHLDENTYCPYCGEVISREKNN